MKITLSEILEWSHGRWANEGDCPPELAQLDLQQMASLKRSEPGSVAFFFSKDFASDLPESNPSVLVTGEAFVGAIAVSGLPIWKQAAIVATADPYLAMARVSAKFFEREKKPTQTPAIHPTAVVSPKAKLGPGVQIGPYCVIEDRCELGPGVRLYSHVYLGEHCEIGADSVLFPNVTLYGSVKVGERVRIHSGTVIGSDGFGYAPRTENGQVVAHEKVYHWGGVEIGDDVEIGSNSCIDQGTFDPTTIGAGTKLDNDIHIAHNCKIGRGVIMCGMSGLAGGTELGDFCYIGGQVGIGERAKIGDRAMVGANSQVGKDIAPGAKVIGNPVRKFEDHYRAHAALNRLMKAHRNNGKKGI